MNHPQISVIVPIYNTETFLDECLQSFVRQTNKSFNVLLIDDGSTDGSGNIAKRYQKQYPELFEYIYQNNKGLGGARNKGMSHVSGRYTMFFDSDDFIGPRGMEQLINHLNKNDVDAVFYNPTIFNMAKKSYEPWHDIELINKVFFGKTPAIPRQNPKMYRLEASVCRTIWKTDFLRKIDFKFLEKVKWEDVPAHFYLFHNLSSCSFLESNDIYYYRFNSGSQITSAKGKTRLDIGVILDETLNYFKDKSWTKKEKVQMIAFFSTYLKWMLKETSDNYRVELIEIMHRRFKQIKLHYIFSFLFCTRGNKKGKIFIACVRFKLLTKLLANRGLINKVLKAIKKIKGK